MLLKRSYKHSEEKWFRIAALEHWPDPKTTEESGLACLIVVVRHLLSFFPLKVRLAITGINDGENLKKFLRCDSEATFRNLYEAFDQQKPFTFQSLVDQPPVADLLDDLTVLHADAKGDIKMHIDWDGKGTESLTDYLKRRLPKFEGEGSERDAENFMAKKDFPWFFRLRYNSKNPKRRFESDLASCTLSSIHRACESKHKPVPRYYAVAVVKLGLSNKESDSLRLYNEYGTPLDSYSLCRYDELGYPLESPMNVDTKRAPWSDQWKIEDGGEYLIYYIRNDNPVIPTPRRKVPDLRPELLELVKDAKQALQNLRLKPQQQSRSSPLQVPDSSPNPQDNADGTEQDEHAAEEGREVWATPRTQRSTSAPEVSEGDDDGNSAPDEDGLNKSVMDSVAMDFLDSIKPAQTAPVSEKQKPETRPVPPTEREGPEDTEGVPPSSRRDQETPLRRGENNVREQARSRRGSPPRVRSSSPRPRRPSSRRTRASRSPLRHRDDGYRNSRFDRQAPSPSPRQQRGARNNMGRGEDRFDYDRGHGRVPPSAMPPWGPPGRGKDVQRNRRGDHYGGDSRRS